MTTDLIQSAYRRTWWGLVLRGLLSVALGIVILWRPVDSVAGFALFIALWALFSGIVQVVHAFDLRSVFDRWWVLLVGGLVSVAFGIAALYYYPGLSLAFAVAWTAWWLLVTGALAVYVAMVERQIGLSWGWTLAFGILSIACGVLAFLNPPITLAALMGLIAGFAIVAGVVQLIGAYRLSAFKGEVTRAVGGPAATR
jgi:uncharacterized membrane protein HdeD (DUF308 family)